MQSNTIKTLILNDWIPFSGWLDEEDCTDLINNFYFEEVNLKLNPRGQWVTDHYKNHVAYMANSDIIGIFYCSLEFFTLPNSLSLLNFRWEPKIHTPGVLLKDRLLVLPNRKKIDGNDLDELLKMVFDFSIKIIAKASVSFWCDCTFLKGVLPFDIIKIICSNLCNLILPVENFYNDFKHVNTLIKFLINFIPLGKY